MKTITPILKILSVLLIVAVSCGSKKNTAELGNKKIRNASWPIFRGDSQLTGIARDELSDRLNRLWIFKTEDAINSSPVIGDGRVFVGSMDCHIYGLDLMTGKKIWAFNTGTIVEAPPLLIDSMLYIGNENGDFFALEAATGTLKWKYTAEGKIIGSANWFGTDGGRTLILFGCYDSKIHCVNAATGDSVWTYDTKNYINGGPALYENTLVFGGCDALLHRVSAIDGQDMAKIDVKSYAAASPAVFEHFAYVGNYDGQLLSVNLKEEKVQWTYEDWEEGDAFFSCPAILRNRLYIGSRDERMHCIDRFSGERVWTFRTQGEIDSSPVVSGDKLIFGSGDGRLYMINRNDGSQIWSYEIGAGIYSSPAVTGGMVVIGADDGNVYAFVSE